MIFYVSSRHKSMKNIWLFGPVVTQYLCLLIVGKKSWHVQQAQNKKVLSNAFSSFLVKLQVLNILLTKQTINRYSLCAMIECQFVLQLCLHIY